MTALYVCCIASGGLQSSSLHPEALARIRSLEVPRPTAQQEPGPLYGQPTFTKHLNNLDVEEKSTVVFEAQVEPAKDPTMKIGRDRR